jgi:hypothetical protein
MMRTRRAAIPLVASLLIVWQAQARVCQSQAQLDALVAEITKHANQHPECFTGKCFPITLRSGDLTPTSGGSLTDKNGDVWTLVPQTGESWYGGVAKNGVLLWPGHNAALRLINGIMYVEEAKFGGWRVQPSNPRLATDGNKWKFVGPDPGPGDNSCGRGIGVAYPASARVTTIGAGDHPPRDGTCLRLQAV